ncbi:glycine zipper 2TM domain-containing protein [Azoarcus sp. KH32C]|uniref:glycine zipper 2TM domain-containing protein n=1 Tax=Azoarcus sp. KH32C TaxID=748247 RepID=UPI0002385D40|nr:glycine zipper 2TM domain-containing protein [Azoarcus sp. KH32C]BAL27521.1 hypothetical protein AZKH_p0638 [Azoarcus sp. KH32C]
MNKSMVMGIGLGALVVTAGGAAATYHLVDSGPKYAEVLAVQPLKETITTPREVCKDVVVNHQAPVKDENQIAGTVIGAVAGGLLGSRIGGGSGKKLATVAGAAAGGYAGKKVQENMQAKDTYNSTETRCTTVKDKSEKVVGYEVEYRLGEEVGHVRMDHEPGARIPVKDGALVLTGGTSASGG